jgi:small basic protein
MGEKLGVDLYLAAILVFGNRMFLNFAIIRRYLLNKLKKQDNI